MAASPSGPEAADGAATGFQGTVDNSAAFHEAFHAFSHFARTTGLWTEGDVKRLREAFGAPAAGVAEAFDEEAAAEAFRAFCVRRMEGAARAEDERGPFARLAALAGGVRAASAEARARERRAARAEDALFDQILLDAYSAVPDMAAEEAGKKPEGKQEAGKKPEGKQEAGKKPEPAPARDPGTKAWRASTPRGGVKVGGHYAYVPLAELVHSGHPLYGKHAGLQERNRVDNRREEQVRLGIVNEFDGERLLEAADTANGAPVVFQDEGADGRRHYFVLSGNGRAMVLGELAARHLYDRYRNPLRKWAEANGLAAPGEGDVLVRVVDDLGGSTLKEVARLSNREATTRYTETEQARVDAENIAAAGIVGLFRANADGSADMTPGANDEFFSRFAAEAGGETIFDENGAVTEDGRARVARALLHVACGQGARGPGTVRRLVTMASTLGVARQRAAAQLMAPAVARLERNPDYAIGPDVSRAMADFLAFAEARRAGKAGTLADFMAQQDLFDPRSALADALLRLLASRLGAREIADYVDAYCDAASKSDADGALGGAANARTRADVWRDAARLVYAAHARAAGERRKGGPRHSVRAASGAAEAAERARREYDAEVARHTNADGTRRPSWMKAPNGKPTNLTERQWVQVRTPSFKKWFGDWETAEAAKAWYDVADTRRILAMPPEDVSAIPALFGKAAFKAAFSGWGEVTNAADGRTVVFPNASARWSASAVSRVR